MATVYVGREVRQDGTEALVALKVIRAELANDEQFAAMFVDEAKILSRLSHPNVIQTLEYGVTSPHRYIAMELLNGRTAADVWDGLTSDSDRFELGLAAWICARVAEGLHSAHELVDEAGVPLSVIHRDVNPTNIFLTHAGEVKLIDFGLARARVRVSKSVDGIVKGKIPYLAPEQAHGMAIDRRIDVYALGTTLWEMVTMKRLFKRDNDVETIKAIRLAHVPDPRETNPDFPEALWKIIERSLRRERDERYATAEEMRTDLDAFARATGPHAPKLAALVSRLFPGGQARQEKWLRDAATVQIPAATMAPPAPVPIASSSMLEVHGGPSSVNELRSLAPLPAASPTAASHDAEPSRTTEPGSSAPRASTRPTRKSRRPEAKTKSKSKSKSKSTSKAKKLRKQALSTNAQPPTEDKRRLSMIVAVVLVALILMAALASRS